MDRLQRSTINMIAGTAGYIAPMLINFVTTPLLLSALGEAAFGLQNLAGVVIGYITVMEMGMDLPIIKYLAEYRAQGDEESEYRLLTNTLQLYGVIGLFGMVVIILGANFLATEAFSIPDHLTEQGIMVFILTGVGFLGSIFALWGRSVMIGLQRLDISNSVTVISSLVGVTLGLGMVYLGFGVAGYVFFRVLAQLISGAVYFPFVIRLLPNFLWKWGFDRQILEKIGHYIRYGIVNRVMGVLTNGLDRILIGAWLGVAWVANYSVSFLIFSSIGYLINNMIQFIFPMSSELYSTNHLDEFRDIMTKATRFITALATLIYIPLITLGDNFLTLWVGQDVASKSLMSLMLLLIAGYITALFAILTVQIMVGIGQIRIFTFFTVFRTLFFSTGCIILIRPLGINGAAWAALFSSLLFDIAFGIITLTKYVELNLLNVLRTAYLKPLSLGVVLAFFCVLARPIAATWAGLILVVSILISSYIVVGFWIGVFGETEKRAVAGIMKLVLNSVRKEEGRV